MKGNRKEGREGELVGLTFSHITPSPRWKGSQFWSFCTIHCKIHPISFHQPSVFFFFSQSSPVNTSRNFHRYSTASAVKPPTQGLEKQVFKRIVILVTSFLGQPAFFYEKHSKICHWYLYQFGGFRKYLFDLRV